MDTFLDIAWRLALVILAPTLFWYGFRSRRPSRRERLRQAALDRIRAK